jgi:hypothetical protein
MLLREKPLKSVDFQLKMASFRPFDGTTAFSVLPWDGRNYHNLLVTVVLCSLYALLYNNFTFMLIIQVMFLGCSDLRNVVATAGNILV